MLFFMVPYLPEIMLSAFDYQFIKRAFLGKKGVSIKFLFYTVLAVSQ